MKNVFGKGLDKVREVVSQNKKRFKEDGFNLDLAYITDDIIAMGFPAGGTGGPGGALLRAEGLYRNHMGDVVKFLDAKHGGGYKVFNLCSERGYDTSYFNGPVATFPFEDHNCPPLKMIVSFCESAKAWLDQGGSAGRVVCVHCKAGKGRTGLMIVSLLLHLGMFQKADEAISYYGSQRTKDGKGVTIPSQLRYIRYYEALLRVAGGPGKLVPAVETPRRYRLVALRLIGAPAFLRPKVTIEGPDGADFLGALSKGAGWKNLSKTEVEWRPEGGGGVEGAEAVGGGGTGGGAGGIVVSGDLRVGLHPDVVGRDFYFWLHTAFVGNGLLSLSARELDQYLKGMGADKGLRLEVEMLPMDQPSRGAMLPQVSTLAAVQ